MKCVKCVEDATKGFTTWCGKRFEDEYQVATLYAVMYSQRKNQDFICPQCAAAMKQKIDNSIFQGDEDE